MKHSINTLVETPFQSPQTDTENSTDGMPDFDTVAWMSGIASGLYPTLDSVARELHSYFTLRHAGYDLPLYFIIERTVITSSYFGITNAIFATVTLLTVDYIDQKLNK